MAQITIAPVTLTNWQGSGSGIVLRVYVNSSFTTADGKVYQTTVSSNPNGLGTFYLQFNCTVSNGSVVTPSITLDSTTDSPDNPQATYTAVIWDTNAGAKGFVQGLGSAKTFFLAPTPTSATWQNIWSAQSNTVPPVTGTPTYQSAALLTDVATGTHYQLQIANGVLEQVVAP